MQRVLLSGLRSAGSTLKNSKNISQYGSPLSSLATIPSNHGIFCRQIHTILMKQQPLLSPTIANPWLSLPVQCLQRRMRTKIKKTFEYKFESKKFGKKTIKDKKPKRKFYSSFKDRFVPLPDGTIMRWQAGKRHNASSKSKKQKKKLKQTKIVRPAYAKMMKKLGFMKMRKRYAPGQPIPHIAPKAPKI